MGIVSWVRENQSMSVFLFGIGIAVTDGSLLYLRVRYFMLLLLNQPLFVWFGATLYYPLSKVEAGISPNFCIFHFLETLQKEKYYNRYR